MATAARINSDLRIIPLEEADLAGVEELFDEQCDEWLTVFKWDYTGPSRLIREVLRHRELSGFAAVRGDRTIGFSFYVIEEKRCSIGDIYVSRNWRGIGADGQMAAAIIETLDRMPRLRRIESQCVSVATRAVDEMFQAHGFNRFKRHYMLREVSVGESGLPSKTRRLQQPGAPDVEIRAWKEEDFAGAARVIHRSYQGQHDSRINSQYSDEEGCAELLSILTEHIWCGDFLADASRVAIDRATGRLVGILISSRIHAGVGHMGQISILPAYQGCGIGRRLIRSAISEFKRCGFALITLAVTSTNTAALHLYQSCGFRTIHTFPVFFRE